MLHLTGTPLAIAPCDHYSGKAPDLVQMKADSAEGFSNVDLSALLALVVIRSFAVPSQVPDSNQGILIDSDFQMQILTSDYTAVLQNLVVRILSYLHNQVECQTAAPQILAGYHTADP